MVDDNKVFDTRKRSRKISMHVSRYMVDLLEVMQVESSGIINLVRRLVTMRRYRGSVKSSS